VKVTFVQPDGSERTIDNVVSGTSLMIVARDNGIVGILGDCGGSCGCGTCHVHVDLSWEAIVGKPDEIEFSALDMVEHVQKRNSRLSCQIKFRPELDGMRLFVVPAV
jgi:2Fe-2S ferredoxin